MKRFVLMLSLLLTAGAVAAQEKPSREQEQLRRLRAQAQQLQQSLAAEQQARQSAETELKALKGAQAAEIEKIGAEARAARGSAQASRRQIEQLEKDLAAERQAREQSARQAEQLGQRLTERERELNEARDTLAGTGRDLEQSRVKAAQSAIRLAQCEKDNRALYSTGIEVLDHYRNRTLGERIGQSEPFAQTARVKLENLIETWRDRLDEARLVTAPSR